MREKLIELLEHDNCPLFMVFGDNVGLLADYLIAHGVTIQTEAENPKTNGDRIRAMSDEELATFINKIVVNHHIKNADNCNHCPLNSATPCDTEGIIDWLKQLVED